MTNGSTIPSIYIKEFAKYTLLVLSLNNIKYQNKIEIGNSETRPFVRTPNANITPENSSKIRLFFLVPRMYNNTDRHMKTSMVFSKILFEYDQETIGIVNHINRGNQANFLYFLWLISHQIPAIKRLLTKKVNKE